MAQVSAKEATAYLIDPLTAPEPSAETGPGGSLGSVGAIPRDTTGGSSTNPWRQGHTATKSVNSRHSRHSSQSSQQGSPIYRKEVFAGLGGAPSSPAYDANGAQASSAHRRRASSLKERFPGDDSHKPLDIIRRDSKKAQRSPHLTKRHLPGFDSIDRLDPTTGIPYHHEGPYDAASLARNNGPNAPIEALKTTNEEALKATPSENIKDSLNKHIPLDGVAVVPPGVEDRMGRALNYEEGSNMMIDGRPQGGEYKRYEGIDYHPDDLKGQGEPAFSQTRAENAKALEQQRYRDDDGVELQDRRRSSGFNGDHAEASGSGSGGLGRKASIKEGLKRRIGSLRHKKD